MSKAAPKPELEALHAALANELRAAITETEPKIVEVPDGLDEDGNPKVKLALVRVRNAAVLNAARQFLKDNGIECAAGHPSKAVAELANATKSLPFSPEDAEERTLQ